MINVASPNNRIRIPSRKLLEQQLKAAASIGAHGLIVHGGHVTAGVDPAEGYDSWRKAVERIERPLPMLIENTAGGDGAMARSLERDRPALGGRRRRRRAAAARSASAWTPATRTRPARTWPPSSTGSRPITGRIDLVHCNNSRDEFGSGRDRHAGLESGQIDPALIVDVVRAAGRPGHLRDAGPGRRHALAPRPAVLTRRQPGPAADARTAGDRR